MSSNPEPLVNVVARAEQLRVRLGDVERERNELRAENERLKQEQSELTAHHAESHVNHQKTLADVETFKRALDEWRARAEAAETEVQRLILVDRERSTTTLMLAERQGARIHELEAEADRLRVLVDG